MTVKEKLDKKSPVKPGEKKAPPVKPVKEKPVKEKVVEVDKHTKEIIVSIEEPVVDELPSQVKVIHKRSEKEFVVSRQHYLDNKGKLVLA